MIFSKPHKNEPEAMQMEKTKREEGQKTGHRARWISRAYLSLALAAVVLTVRTCCPGAVETVRDVLGLGEEGRTRAAFAELRDALAEGESVVAAFAESYQALAGETP